MTKERKERIMKYISLAAVCAIGALAVVAGCRKAAPPAPPKQSYEIARGSNLIAQTVEPIEVAADLHLADLPDPVRVTLRIMPGTWVVPEQLLRIEGDGSGVVCDDKKCEVQR